MNSLVNDCATSLNTIKQIAKMVGRQTVLDLVWSPNISRLNRALNLCFWHPVLYVTAPCALCPQPVACLRLAFI